MSSTAANLPLDSAPDFYGAKVALLLEDNLLVYRRDDSQEIPFPNLLDLPGGGREGNESGIECVVRETAEEFGIQVDPNELRLAGAYKREGRSALFFVGHLSRDQVREIVQGDEGHSWQLMPMRMFLQRDDAVPHLQRRLRHYLSNE